jgi:hypothetical protein
VSKKSVFDGRKPIRGGIPFIFPQERQYATHHLFEQFKFFADSFKLYVHTVSVLSVTEARKM